MISQEQILSSIDTLPSMSGVVASLSSLIQDPNSGPKDFESVIMQDPALTTNLLKLANSAFFGCPRKIETVRQAVAMLGNKRIFELALTDQFSKTLPKNMQVYGLVAMDFWRHSIAVAVLAQHFAQELSLKDVNFIFTAGLLHDVGKLVIYSFLSQFSDSFLDCLREKQMLSIQAERETLGLDHAQVGGAILKKWNIPDLLCDCALYHHNPNELPNKTDQVLLDIIHISDAFAHTMGFGADVGELSRNIYSETISRLGLRVRTVEKVTSETLEEINDLGGFFANPPGDKA